MAQSTGTGGTRRPVSTARTPASAAKKPAPKTGAKNNAKPAARGGASAKKPKPAPAAAASAAADRALRRSIGAAALFFLFLVAGLAYFPIDAWLVRYFRIFLQGVFGCGWYAAAPALFLGGVTLLDREGRVTGRLLCSLLLPLCAGAFVHMLWCARSDYFSGGFVLAVKDLWRGGQSMDTRCGGVLAGMLGVGLELSISIYGGVAVTVVSGCIMLVKATGIDFSAMAERARSSAAELRAPIDYAAMDDEFFGMGEPDAGVSMKPPAVKRFHIDIPLDDEDELPVPELPKRKKARTAEPFDVERQDELFLPEKKPAKKPAAKPAETTKNVKPLSMDEAAAIAGVELSSLQPDGPAAKKPEPAARIDKAAEAAAIESQIADADAGDKPAYAAPPTDLLAMGKAETVDARDEIAKNRERLESTIRSFGVDAHIVSVTHGPTVTRFDLELEQGVKLNKITNLAGDIALALGVVSVRIAPIPDKISTVGVEVPNRHVNTVYLRDIVESKNFEKAPSRLSFAIGKDIGGNAIVGNIAKLPHLLIAGTTGSGKSVCINSLIISLLYKSTPDEVRMIMIDPKMVELGVYNGMPHLFVPVVTDPKKAAGALQWAVVEMLKRYRLFSEAGVRDLAAYNARQRRLEEPTVPQVVIIIDELADLMLVASKEVEESICRVAQMGRASGMHLVIATQRPSADVITGLMKANIPSRIAFAVSSAMESRIIMDQSGAEKLIGSGDMLYCPLGIGKPMRVQGAFVSDDEREKVIDYVKQVGEAEYSDEILGEIEKAAADKNSKNAEPASEEKGKDDFDELLPDAVDVVFETKQASVTLLQRKLKLGYARAARLVDQLEQLGVLGPFEGSKPRQILITKEQWQEMQYSTGVAPADTIAGEFGKVSSDASFAEPGPAVEDELL